MAYIAMAYVVMANVVMAYRVMAFVVTASPTRGINRVGGSVGIPSALAVGALR